MKKLTKREAEVLDLLIKGKTNKEIASSLYISTHTVKAILEKLYEKLNIHNRVQLAVYYLKVLNSGSGQKTSPALGVLTDT